MELRWKLRLFKFELVKAALHERQGVKSSSEKQICFLDYTCALDSGSGNHKIFQSTKSIFTRFRALLKQAFLAF